jgi:hypothetical protein
MNSTSAKRSRRPDAGLPQGADAPPRLGSRVLGWTLMTFSLGLVSCQSLFYL